MPTTITQASTSTPTSLAQREDCTRRHTQLADSGQSTDGSPRGPVDVSIPAGNNQPTDTSRINHLVVNDVTRASVAPITVASATPPVEPVGMSQRRDWIREGVQTRAIDRASQCNNDARIVHMRFDSQTAGASLRRGKEGDHPVSSILSPF